MSGNNGGHNRGRSSNPRSQLHTSQPAKRARTTATIPMNVDHQNAHEISNFNPNLQNQPMNPNPYHRGNPNYGHHGSMGIPQNFNNSAMNSAHNFNSNSNPMNNQMNQGINAINMPMTGMSVSHSLQPPVELEKYVLTSPKKENLNKRLGPPEFFPLEEGCNEDILNGKTISEGFVEPNYLDDEFGTMRSKLSILNLDDFKAKMLQSIKEVEWKKSSCPKERGLNSSSNNNLNSNSYSNSNGKKIKFPPLTTCTKDYQEKWMRALASSEPLHRLATKVPHGFKGDALLRNLVKESVPVLRATWFIKIILLNNSQKKSEAEAHTEWTNTISQFLFQEINSMIKVQKSFEKGKEDSEFQNAISKIKMDLSYLLRLLRWNYQEGLLNSDLFFGKLVDNFSETIRFEELIFISSILLDYLPDLSRSSKNHIRKLISCAVEKLNQVKMMSEEKDITATEGENSKNAAKSTKFQAYYYLLNLVRFSFFESPDSLASLDSKSLNSIMSITKPDKFPSCWTSSDWLGSEMENPFFVNSWNENQNLVQQLHDKHQCAGEVTPINQQLYQIIEELDSSLRFKSTSNSNSKSSQNLLNDLFQKLFSPFLNPSMNSSNRDSKSSFDSSDTLLGVIFVLCEWTVSGLKEENSTRRYLSCSLLRMLNDNLNLSNKSGEVSEDSEKNPRKLKPNLQDFLFHFLDRFSPSNLKEFSDVVKFYGELIQQELFSHNFYVRSLISKGHLENIQKFQGKFEDFDFQNGKNSSILHCFYLNSISTFDPNLNSNSQSKEEQNGPSLTSSSSSISNQSDLLHQQNQRRVALSMFLPFQLIQEQENELNRKKEELNNLFKQFDDFNWIPFNINQFFNPSHHYQLWNLISYAVKLFQSREKVNTLHFIFTTTITQKYGEMTYLYTILTNTLKRLEKSSILPSPFLDLNSLSIFIVSLLEKYETINLFSSNNNIEEVVGNLLELSYSFIKTSKNLKEFAWNLLEKINSKNLFERFASRMNESMDGNEMDFSQRVSGFIEDNSKFLEKNKNFFEFLKNSLENCKDPNVLVNSCLEFILNNLSLSDSEKTENEEGIPISWLFFIGLIQSLVATNLQQTQSCFHNLFLSKMNSVISSESLKLEENSDFFLLFKFVKCLMTRSVFNFDELISFIFDQISSKSEPNENFKNEKNSFVWMNLLLEVLNHYASISLDFPMQLSEKTEKKFVTSILNFYFQSLKRSEENHQKKLLVISEKIVKNNYMREVSVGNILSTYYHIKNLRKELEVSGNSISHFVSILFPSKLSAKVVRKTARDLFSEANRLTIREIWLELSLFIDSSSSDSVSLSLEILSAVLMVVEGDEVGLKGENGEDWMNFIESVKEPSQELASKTSLMCKLLRSLDHSVQNELMQQVIKILQVNDIKQSPLSSFLGKKEGEEKEDSNIGGFVSFVSMYMLTASDEQKVEFVTSLTSQFESTFSQVRKENGWPFNASLWTIVRLILLTFLVPIIKKQPVPCQLEELCKVLLHLLCETQSLSNSLQDVFFNEISEIFIALLESSDANFSTEAEAKRNSTLLDAIKDKLKVQLKNNENVSVAQQNKIDLALPFFQTTSGPIFSTSNSSNQSSKKSKGEEMNILLEDYQEGPLSPSMFGAIKMERTGLSYANQLFSHKRLKQE